MESPIRIFFVGNSPAGGRLRTHFEGKDLPTSIRIKGSTDNQPVRLKKNGKGIVTGIWTSQKKYANRMVTLELMDSGVPVKECKYDACGDVIIDNPKVTLNPTSNISLNSGVVSYVWTTVVEEAVDQFCSEKRVHGATGEWDAFDADEPTGQGSTYTSTDIPTISANLDYRLRAIFMDGTENVILSNTINFVVPPNPHATIGTSFSAAFNETTSVVDLKWISTEEVSIKGYSLRIAPKGSTAPPIETSWVIAGGVGFPYNYPSQPDSGEYTYTIVAILASGAEQVPALATATAIVPIPV